MSKTAVIFDVDGVLVDSYQAHFRSWQQLFSTLNVEYGEAAFAADFGRTSRDILCRRLRGDLSEERIQELDRQKEANYRDIVRHDFPAMEGAAELIDSLATAGFLLAIGSSGPPENVELAIEHLDPLGQITAVVTGNDVTRGKPDPQVFLIAAERLGVLPAMCVVVEDAAHGVEAAHGAGMRCVALTGTTTRDNLAKADLVVDSLHEVTTARFKALVERPDQGGA
ncbi:MAG: HAD family phosphatase [Planctomycetes bacterium]|nr:HAD family phosphatase [Planctomycetota bacterium]